MFKRGPVDALRWKSYYWWVYKAKPSLWSVWCSRTDHDWRSYLWGYELSEFPIEGRYCTRCKVEECLG